MKKIYIVIFFLSLNSCFAQDRNNDYPILDNTFWVNNMVSCDQFIFTAKHSVIYINCELAMDTIICSYQLITKDTLIVQEITGKWENTFMADSIPVEKHGQTVYCIKNDTITPIYCKIKNSKTGVWERDNSIKFETNNYWYNIPQIILKNKEDKE